MKRFYSILSIISALFVLSISANAQNTCAAPKVISSLPYTATGLTTCGTVNDYHDFCSEANYMDGEDYVFSYTPSASGCINLALTGTKTYTGVFVFSGCPGAAGYSCVGKATSSSGNPTLAGVPLVAGTTYYIIVDTWPTPTCTPFNISIKNCPPGTTCQNPKVIPSLPYKDSNTTCGAGDDYGATSTTPYGDCAPNFNDGGEDIVYTWTATHNQCISISVTGWSYPGDGAFMVSRSCPTASPSGCIAVSEGSGNTGPAAVNNIQVFAGTTIYITIDGDDFDAPCMPFVLQIDTCAQFIPDCGYSPKAGDYCAQPTPICDFTGYCGSTSTSYTPDHPSNIDNVFCGSIENNSWISFVAGATTATFNIFFGNCTNGDGIQALVLDATNCTNFVVKSNCYEPIAAQGSGVITATNLVVGHTYLIMIDGYAGDYCDYIIQAKSGILLPVNAGPDVKICPGKTVTLTATNGNNVYSWSTGQTAPSISVKPDTTTSYVVKSASGLVSCPQPDSDTVTVIVVPTIQANVTNVVNANSCTNTCDGSAAITVSGGATPYKTSWSNGATTNSVSALCPGNTYSVTVTDSLGCQAKASVVMPPPVVAGVTFTAPPCGATTVNLVTSTTSGTGSFTYTGPGTLTITNTSTSNYTASSNVYGSYDITWTVTNGACSASVTKTVNFRQPPVADFTAVVPACAAKTTTITTAATAGTGSYTFTGPGSLSFTNTGTNAWSATATAFGTYVVTWTVNNAGCTATITKNIVFTAQPTAAFTVTGPSCNALSFTAATTASVGTGSWTYTGPSGSVLNFTSTGTNAYSASASQYGTYTITWTVNNSGCIATASQNVTFDKQPTANAGTDQNICGLSTSFSAIPSLGSSNWTQISGPGTATITTPTSATSAVTAPSYGSYTFRWTEINGSCPASTDDMVIVFSQNPSGNAGTNQNVCGFSTTLAATTTVGSGSWSGSGIASPTNPNTSVSTATAGAVVYTWTVSNGSCPSVSSSVTVNFSKKPTPNAGPDQSVCGLGVTLNATAPTAAGSWIAPSSATFGSTTNPKSTASVSTYGTYNFVWQESNSPCPLSTDTVLITFVQTPNPNAGVDQAICGQTTNFAATASPFTGNWTGPGSIASPGSRTSSVTGPGYGTYTYVWTEFNASPCPGKTDTVLLTFAQQPVSNAGPDKNICGNSTNLAAVRSIGTSSGKWTGPAGVSYGNVNSPTTAVLVSAYGSYTFTWTETNGAICPSSTDQVTINFVPPSNPNAGPDGNVCGVNAGLHAVPSFGLGTWSYGGPGILTFSNINDPNATIVTNTFGKYNVAWTEGNSPCIANTDTVIVLFNEPPTVDAGTSPDKVCGLDYKLNASASVGTPKWSWVPAAGVTGTINFKFNNDTIPQAQITATDYGQYYLLWKIVNGACVPPADTVALSFFKKPTPDAGPDLESCDTLKAQLSGVTSVIGTWHWSSPTGGSINFTPDADRPDPIAEATAPGIYKLFFSEQNDPVCGIVTDSLTVNFLQKPTANAGLDNTACGTSYILSGNSSNLAIGKWTFVSSSNPSYTATFADASLFNSQVSINMAPPAAGVTMTFRWTLTNGSCPIVSDDVSITFTQVPNSVDAGPDQVDCNTMTATLNANDFGGTGIWSIVSSPSGATAAISNTSSPSATLNSDKYGVYQVQRTVSVAGCPGGVIDLVNIDFRKLPTPNAGPDNTICGSAFTLAGTVPSGRITGAWSQVSGPGTAVFAADSSATSGVDVGTGFGLYTFRWSESNLGCPTITDDVAILFQQQPVANAGPDAAICGLIYDLNAVPSGSSTASTYSGYWLPFSGPGTTTLTPSNGASPTTNVTVSNYGFYTLLWNETNGICPASVDSVKIQFVNPSKPNAGPDQDICGLTDTLAAIPSFGVGEWVNFNGNPAKVNFVNPLDPNTIVNVDNYGVYRFDWLEANSPCFANSDYTLITFHQQPVSNAGPDADTCSIVAQLHAVPSATGTDYTGTWSGPLGSAFSNVNDPNATVDMTSAGFGTYTFTWTEVNGAMCSASVDAVTISFVQTPVADAGISPGKVCGKSVNLTANPSVGIGQWSATGPDKFNFSFPTAPVTDGIADSYGNYTLYWKEINFGTHGGSCSSIDSLLIELYQQPSITLGPDSAVCGKVITLTATQSVPGSTIQWSQVGPGSVTFSAPNSTTTTVTTNNIFGHTMLSFVESVGNGACVSSDTTQITFVQLPVANAGAPDSVCALSSNINAVPSAGNGSWTTLTPGVVFSPDLSSPSVSITAPAYGVYKFVWKEDNGLPCPVSRDTVTVGFFKVPQPKAGLDFSVCGPVTKLNATATTNPGKWTYNGSLAVAFADATDPKTTVTLTPASHADYGLLDFTWTETNVICTASDAVSVYFSEMPNADAGPDQNICGLDFVLSANPSVGTGKWVYPGPAADLKAFNNTTTSNASGTASNYGPYGFNWIEKNAGVCPADTDQVQLLFNQAPVAQAGPDSAVCSLSYPLRATASVGVGTWTKASGPGIVTFADKNNDSTLVTVSQQGDYIFAWTEVNSTTCVASSDSLHIYFEKAPKAQAGPDLTICGSVTNLNATPSIGTGQWTFIGDTTATIVFVNANSPTTSFGSNKFGPHPLIWEEINTAVCGPKTDTMVVTFIQQPVAAAGGPTYQICGTKLNLEAVPSVGVGQWTQISGPDTGSFDQPFTGTTLFSAANGKFGTYVLRWSEDNGSPCTVSSGDVSVTFHRQPLANAGPAQEVCGLGAGLKAVPSVGKGKWLLIPNGTQSAGFADDTVPTSGVAVSQFGDYQFVWTETNGTVCPPDQNVTLVSFKQQPVAQAGPDQEICGQTATLGSTNSSGSGSWSALNPPSPFSISDTNSNTPDVTATFFGKFNFIWTEVNGKVCPASTDTVALEFLQQPLANAGADDRICGQKYVLKANPTVGKGTWTTASPGAIFTPAASDPNATVTVTEYGKLIFTWTETNKAPCTASSDDVEIEFIEGPTGTLTISPDTICSGDPAKLVLHLTGSAPFKVIYTTNNVAPTPINGATDGYVVNLNPTLTSVYEITSITDGSGKSCTSGSSEPVKIEVNQRPLGQIKGNFQNCSGDSLTIPVTFTGVPPFSATFTNGTTQSFDGPGPYTFNYAPGAVTTLGMTAVSDRFCSGTANASKINVTIHALPSGTVSKVGGNLCDGQNARLKFDMTVGKAPWTVYYSNGTTSKTLNMPNATAQTSETVSVGTTTFTIDSIIDGNGCKGTGTSVDIVVYANPAYELTGNTVICQGSSSDVQFTFTPKGSGPWVVDYTNGQANTSTPAVPDSGSISLSPTTNTTYTFTKVTDQATGCSTVENRTLQIQVVPAPILGASLNKAEMCANDSAEITFTFSGVEPFEVTLNNGQTYTNLHNGDKVVVFATSTTTFKVNGFKDGSGLSCQGTVNVNLPLLVDPLPVVTFEVNKTSSCLPMIPVFVNTTDPSMIGNSGCAWTFGDATTSPDCTPTHQYTKTGYYDISLTIVSPKGCTATLTKKTLININPDPVAKFSWTPENPNVTENKVQFANETQGAKTYKWDMAGLASFTTANPSYDFPNTDSGTYVVCLTATSDSGCVNKTCRPLFVTGQTSVFVPNAFTPDGDGLNDVFMPSALGVDITSYEFTVFDRWGEVIFVTGDPKKGWDGNLKGNPVKSDVYPWKLIYKDKYGVTFHQLNGMVTLIK